jgi:nucleoside-triphosphatase
MKPRETAFWIVTGGRGTGKTTFCRHMAELARQVGWDVAGILSLPRMENGVKTGIFALDLRHGEQRLLAGPYSGEVAGTPMCRWIFSEQTLLWANNALAAAIPCDLLIVDEIGPLELEREAGLLAWRSVIAAGAYRVALAVVRPECVHHPLLEGKSSGSLIISSPEQAGELAQTMFAKLFRTP